MRINDLNKDMEQIIRDIREAHRTGTTTALSLIHIFTGEVFGWAVDIAAKKKPGLPFDRVRLETYDEGLCVQQLHVGPYSTEQETIDQIGLFIRDNGLTDQCGTCLLYTSRCV